VRDSAPEGTEGNEGQGGKTQTQGQHRKQGGEGESSEENIGELFEIFKQQQELRNALQDWINKKGIGADGQKLLDAMEKHRTKPYKSRTYRKIHEKNAPPKASAFKVGESRFKNSKAKTRSVFPTQAYSSTFCGRLRT